MSLKGVFRCWWPLAVSWLLMAFEIPIVLFVLGKMPDSQTSIAAFGGVALPLGFIIESPILMLLSASTTLSRDRASYEKLHSFMHSLGFLLTLFHIVVTFTPLFYVLVRDILAVPEEVIEPTRHSLMFMTPWTWAIAYRRLNQGLLIRFGQSGAVGTGTAVRFIGLLFVLGAGYLFADVSPSSVAGLAVSTAVIMEALFVKTRADPIINTTIRTAPAANPALNTKYLVRFYVPLALTTILGMLTQPIGSASLSRMSDSFASLAVWPVLGGLIFIFRSTALAMVDVSVAKLHDPEDGPALFPFCLYLIAAATGLLLLIEITPMAQWWFKYGASFPPELTAYGENALFLTIPLPALTVLQCWYQGNLLAVHKTGPITEAIAIFLGVVGVLLVVGIAYSDIRGLYFFNGALLLGTLAQTLWLFRSKRTFCRDDSGVSEVPAPSEVPFEDRLE